MVASSNACIPASVPVIAQVPPLPNTIRGEPTNLDGQTGRLSSGKTFLSYPSGKLCVVRSLEDGETLPNSKKPILVYRGHQYATSSVKVSTSGAYVCSGDTRGKLRVWSLDHEEHLCKLDTQGLSSAVRDIAWDGESKRIAYAGDRMDNQSVCTRVIQWDTGNTQGTLYQHLKGKSCAIDFKPDRPFRLVTGGKEDGRLYFHKGPPFQKMAVENGAPCEDAHSKGVNCVRYTSNGELVASVGGDKSLCIYSGTDLALKCKVEGIHSGTIYACSWASDNKSLMTSSADGTCKLFEVSGDGSNVVEKHTWKVAEHMMGKALDKAPRGGMQLGCAFAGGTQPVSVSTNNQIAILPMPGSKKSSIEILTGHNAPIGAVAFDHTKGLFYTGDSDGILCKWDLKKLKAIERIVPADNKELTYQVHSGAVSGLTVLKDRQLLSCGWDDTAYYIKDGKLTSEKLDITAQPVGVSTGTSLTAILTVKGVMLLKDGKQVSKGVLPLSYEANCVLVTKDDKTIYVGGNDCKIYVYIPVDGTFVLKERHVISDGHLKPIHSLAESNDGTMLAAGDVRDVCVYKTADFSPLVAKSKWCFHLQKVTALAWSPDDKVLASGGADDSIYLWNLDQKMRRIHYQYAHRGSVVGMTFLKDTPGLTLISAGADSCLLQLDVTADVKAKFG
ncbi:WD repeat-containing protein [Nitzschia inconspicua]|uniref:WD repeat-containing protein n=1 Tax=Nitzschia inconspicua TaxID=303405 RepID=A0A9K3L3S7_9STRA|nr:WD repeat-containing protein [Nitzschia inconspicua]